MLGKQLLRAILGRTKKKPKKHHVDPKEQSFDHIWKTLIKTGATKQLSDGRRQNILVLQMGKVASMSIRSALRAEEVNAFHCHGLSAARQDLDLGRLRRADFTLDLVSYRLRQHIQYVCLSMLVRWYRTYKLRHGRQLKVVALARDPVRRYASVFIQHQSYARPLILARQRAPWPGQADAGRGGGGGPRLCR